MEPHPTAASERKPKRVDRPGRQPTDARPLWNGILWVLRTGAQWSELPRKYPPYQTCHRWFQGWVKDGTFRKVLRELARDLKERGGFDLEEGFVDAPFSGAKRGPRVGKTKRGSERRVKLIAPHRRGRKRKATQGGREPRRYKRRWKVERFFAWLHFFRRLVTRYEVKAENFLGFLHPACALLLLRQL
jgi:transposase